MTKVKVSVSNSSGASSSTHSSQHQQGQSRRSGSGSSSSRDRDRNRDRDKDREKNRQSTSNNESGTSSQCDTPPLNDKDGTSSQGKYAGVSPESVLCMAEQIGIEVNVDGATNLAEDVSYRIRQVVNQVALHSHLMKKTRVDTWDVNNVLKLMDTGPIIGIGAPQWLNFGDEKLCAEVDFFVNVRDSALKKQSHAFQSLPNISVEWITNEKCLASGSTISSALQNYYTKVARAILNLKRRPKEVAVADLAINTRIGPIMPNLFNLAVLVLNDDNLNALHVPAKRPLQSNVLEMVDALCSNPCSLDTNIQQQFQRLFPVMVSNIIAAGPLAEKMIAVLTKITRTWPPFTDIGKNILFDYLSQGTKERLTAPMLRCLAALGRQALVDCLGPHLQHLDQCVHGVKQTTQSDGLWQALLDVSTFLYQSEPSTFQEDLIMTDYTLYEMLGDSVLPRRILSIVSNTPSEPTESTTGPKPEEDFSFMSFRINRRFSLKLLNSRPRRPVYPKELAFDIVKYNYSPFFMVKIAGGRPLPIKPKKGNSGSSYRIGSTMNSGKVAVACGLLKRFRYKLPPKEYSFPIFSYM